jgi:hypothetical protein
LARDYVVEVQGALRVERGLLNTERRLAEEMREATRETRAYLLEVAESYAPQPRLEDGAPWEEKGAGIGAELKNPGGVRRFAGRAAASAGGGPLVSLTYEVSLFIRDDEPGHLAAFFETGTGLKGPGGSEYSIFSKKGKKLGPLIGFVGSQPERGTVPTHAWSVTHPGISPRPFLEDAVRDSSDEVELIYDRAVANAIKGF